MDKQEILTYRVHDVAEYINWVYFFHAWGFSPRYATIANVCDCVSCQSSWIFSFPYEERIKAQEACHNDSLKPLISSQKHVSCIDSVLLMRKATTS